MPIIDISNDHRKCDLSLKSLPSALYIVFFQNEAK
ncbi:mCG147544 [Mus musculus]|nr:mCG147544 [Mus musculus]